LLYFFELTHEMMWFVHNPKLLVVVMLMPCGNIAAILYVLQ